VPLLYPSVCAVLLALTAGPARADGGPNLFRWRGPVKVVRIRVTFQGEPLTEKPTAALLSWRDGESALGDPHEGTGVPGLDRVPLGGPGGGHWRYWNGKVPSWAGDDLTFQLGRYGPGRPERVRLAVYLPSRQNVFVTEAAPLRHDRSDNFFIADLAPNGTGTLERQDAGRWRVLLEKGFGLEFVVAFCVTLVSELAFLFLWCWFARLPRARFLLLGLVANVLSVPVLWLLVLWGLEGGNPWVMLAAGEVGVVLFEGLLYARFGPLPRGKGLLLSALANLASFAVCFGAPLAWFIF
jgi:hypothetical protein